MRKISHTILGVALLGFALLMSPAASVAQEQPFKGVTLVVGTFGGSWKDRINEHIGEEFRKRGGQLEFVTGNPRILLSKIVAARGQPAPMDVFETVDSTWPLIVQGKFARKLNLAHIPNVQHLDKRMYDDFKVANWITEEGLIYHIAKFKELGLSRPTKFSDLLDPKLKGLVSVPDINVNTIINPIVGFAADGGGDENNIDPGLKRIRDLGVHSFWSSGTQLTQLFQSGDIIAAVTHAGWGVRLHDAGIEVGMVHPVVKGNVGMASRGFAAVTANTEHPEAAEWYINMLVSEEMQTILHTRNGIVPTNQSVQQMAAKAPKLDASGKPFLLLSPQEISNLYYIDYSNFKMEDWTAKWNRVVIN